ncbi:thioredoxin family protein [Chitinimonas sp.]|uniref:thioredoxin family protein n=1 Tax=Chitinimonas sp. TaxID=1934313 RepID=UPI0035B1F314
MVSLSTPLCEFNQPAVNFELPGVDGRQYSLSDVRGPNGVLVMFICNHCPFVKAIRERLVETCRELESYGIRSVAISSNNPTAFPEDDFDHMKAYAKAFNFSFPYLYDESQDVARAYGAVCTPDFFGYNSELKLQYRGRFDDAGRRPVNAATERELFQAMKQIAMTGEGPSQQAPSAGCAIKWR